VAHGTTVAKVASDQGNETAISWADHIIETLEHNVRDGRRGAYALADLILKGDPESLHMAREMSKLIVELRGLRKAENDEWEPD
jgi:hypothetical protein